jgi:hypothetical protein
MKVFQYLAYLTLALFASAQGPDITVHPPYSRPLHNPNPPPPNPQVPSDFQGNISFWASNTNCGQDGTPATNIGTYAPHALAAECLSMTPNGPIASMLVSSAQGSEEYRVDFYTDVVCQDYLGWSWDTGSTCFTPPKTWQSMYINYR